MKTKLLIVASVIAAVSIGGCSTTSSSTSGSTTASTSAPSKQDVCAARDKLKSSVTALANPSVLTGGKAGIQTALDSVKTSLDSVAGTAKATYQPQVDAVKSAVTDLQTALDKFGNGSTTSNLQAAATAITNIGTTSTTLIAMLQVDCPSA